MNWLERARREVAGSVRRATANTAEGTLTSVTAVVDTELPLKSAPSIGGIGSAPSEPMLESDPMPAAFNQRAAVVGDDARLATNPVERSTSDERVLLKGGFSVLLAVLQVLWRLEDRGARFELKPDGAFWVMPASVLTADDIAVLRAHQGEARRVLEYEVDDSHLFSDTSHSP